MAIDRHSIIEATELMGSAASTIKSIMRAGSLSDIHNAQRMQVNSGCSALEDGCPALAAAVNDAALFLHDFWTEIEVNKALLLETESFLRRYQSFRLRWLISTTGGRTATMGWISSRRRIRLR